MIESTTTYTGRKKLGAALASLAVIAAVLLVGTAEATADGPAVGVGVLTDGGTECVMLDASGSFTPGVMTDDFRITSAPDNQGQSGDKDHLVCTATVTNDTGKAITFSSRKDDLGVRCGIGVSRGLEFQATDVIQQTISASGQARLTCHD